MLSQRPKKRRGGATIAQMRAASKRRATKQVPAIKHAPGTTAKKKGKDRKRPPPPSKDEAQRKRKKQEGSAPVKLSNLSRAARRRRKEEAAAAAAAKDVRLPNYLVGNNGVDRINAHDHIVDEAQRNLHHASQGRTDAYMSLEPSVGGFYRSQVWRRRMVNRTDGNTVADRSCLAPTGSDGNQKGFRAGIDGEARVANNDAGNAHRRVMADTRHQYDRLVRANTQYEYNRLVHGRGDPDMFAMQDELHRQLINSEARQIKGKSKTELKMLAQVTTADGRRYETDLAPPKIAHGISAARMIGGGVSGKGEDLYYNMLMMAMDHIHVRTSQERRRATRAAAKFAGYFDMASDTGELVIADVGIVASTLAHGRVGFMASAVKSASGEEKSAEGSAITNSTFILPACARKDFKVDEDPFLVKDGLTCFSRLVAHPHYHEGGQTHWKNIVCYSIQPITVNRDRRVLTITQFTPKGIQVPVNQFIVIPQEENTSTISYPCRSHDIIPTNPGAFFFFSLDYFIALTCLEKTKKVSEHAPRFQRRPRKVAPAVRLWTPHDGDIDMLKYYIQFYPAEFEDHILYDSGNNPVKQGKATAHIGRLSMYIFAENGDGDTDVVTAPALYS